MAGVLVLAVVVTVSVVNSRGDDGGSNLAVDEASDNNSADTDSVGATGDRPPSNDQPVDRGSTMGPAGSTTQAVPQVVWEQVSDAPPGNYIAGNVTTAWTGEEVLVWGDAGSTTVGSDNRTGAAWNPQTDTWRALAEAPFEARNSFGVWTGTELVVGPVEEADEPGSWVYGAYEPTADRWRTVADADPGSGVPTAWTGSRVVLLQSNYNDPVLGALDPLTGQVTPVPAPPGRGTSNSRPFGGLWLEAVGDGRIAAANSMQAGEVTISVSDSNLTEWQLVGTVRDTTSTAPVWTGSELLVPGVDLVGYSLDGTVTGYGRIPHPAAGSTLDRPVWADGHLWTAGGVWIESTRTWLELPPLPDGDLDMVRYGIVHAVAGRGLLAFGGVRGCPTNDTECMSTREEEMLHSAHLIEVP